MQLTGYFRFFFFTDLLFFYAKNNYFLRILSFVVVFTWEQKVFVYVYAKLAIFFSFL